MMSGCGANERVVLTGATGFLGRQILNRLLDERPQAQVVLLLRDSAGQSARQRLDGLLAGCPDPDKRELLYQRIQVVPSDIRAGCCALSEHDWCAVADGATHVIHGAASVRFDQTVDEAREVNVGGARNLLAIAEEAFRRGAFERFVYISTAFVAGSRKGLVREDELDVGQQFRNSYERSKCEAESLVRRQMTSLPATVLRPSIIVGDSRTGVTSSFNTLYWPLRAYAQRGWRIAPGRPGTVVDLVPVNFVADAALHLTFLSEAAGRTFHLAAGPRRSATIGQIADSAARFFRRPPPRFVNMRLFTAILHPLLLATVWGRRRRILKQGRFYRPYLDMDLEFDTTQADALLETAGIRPPHVREYLERLFAFCLESDWGRRPASQEFVA